MPVTIEAFCVEVRAYEELCYVEHRFNPHVIPLARKHNILGMPVPAVYGGRGADTRTYARALARIGQEGTGVRTFFSGHTSIGQYPILMWGNEEQKQGYLPASCRGDKILAFGLTEPDAGSNPLEMTMTYERRGERFVMNGVKYLISNAGIATTIVTFAYPLGGGRISAFVIDTDSPGCAREDLLAKMGMPTANTRHVRTDRLRDAHHESARLRRRRLSHRHGHLGERTAERGRRLPGRH